ncbi:hypothetical protein FYK55_20985 [Roseiconus nitratireducens]|uniref:N-acetyltransferase domain-containing protein n=1 Tax=Roseiconus nitratireducens TaxID=2605748 RepID=A0A5M6D051_9BACT|nr:hypothetical protein [Roseiconus nitratireducens]KAA5540486.1 hypothetical protein FYK55_20985 [Roseiconus nitratireducens]
MSEIRDFCNSDLPDLTRVWSEHWTAAGSPPPISSTIIERAVLSRTFFSKNELLVASVEGQVEGWCHLSCLRDDLASTDVPAPAVLSAICFTHAGLACCDELLSAAQERARQMGCETMVVGPLRDQSCGYVGLAPIGHGIGVPDVDVRASSLLTRHGFSPAGSYDRMVVTTTPYRPPVSREMMQFRRTTRTERDAVIPQQGRYASAMSHLDIEHHRLINHRTGQNLANVRLWLSDPEAQVMSCSEAILDLSPITTPGQLTMPETFLVAAMIQTMANRCVFRVETAINAEHGQLREQLQALHFQSAQRGQRWKKTLS